jgi:hypothetical protein
MSNLKATIESLAADFAKQLIGAIKGASLQEILNETVGAASAPRAGRRARRAAAPVVAEAAKAAAPARGGRKAKGGRLARRSPEALAKAKEQIVALLGKSPKGLRSEEIRAKLGLSKQEIPRPLADALAEKLISKKGEKRATTYFKK